LLIHPISPRLPYAIDVVYGILTVQLTCWQSTGAFEQRRDIPDLSDWDGIKLKTQGHPSLAPCEDCFYHSGNGLEAVSGNCIRMLMSGICGKMPEISLLPSSVQTAEDFDSDMKKLSFARNFFYQFALDCVDGRCVQRAENSGKF